MNSARHTDAPAIKIARIKNCPADVPVSFGAAVSVMAASLDPESPPVAESKGPWLYLIIRPFSLPKGCKYSRPSHTLFPLVNSPAASPAPPDSCQSDPTPPAVPRVSPARSATDPSPASHFPAPSALRPPLPQNWLSFAGDRLPASSVPRDRVSYPPCPSPRSNCIGPPGLFCFSALYPAHSALHQPSAAPFPPPPAPPACGRKAIALAACSQGSSANLVAVRALPSAAPAESANPFMVLVRMSP